MSNPKDAELPYLAFAVVGSIVAHNGNRPVPDGWAAADGSTYDPDELPELDALLEGAYGRNTLPNIRIIVKVKP